MSLRLLALVSLLALAAQSFPAAAEAPGDGPGHPPAREFKKAPSAGPTIPDTPAGRKKLLEELYGQLAKTREPDKAETVAQLIEQLWQASGSDTVDLLMQRAGAAIAGKNNAAARELLDAVVGLEPRYAEAWNRRAALNYANQNREAALADIARVLSLDRRHFRALEGMGQILRELGQDDLALKAYRALSEVYPGYKDAVDAAEALGRKVEGQGI